MKKLITLICIAGILPAFSQSLTFSNQTITVLPSQLAIESVEYHAASVITNAVIEWVDGVEVTTNEQHSGLGDFVVETNAVSQQVSSEVIITNAATWICNVRFDLPKGHTWELNGFPVSIRRFSTLLGVPVDPATVQAVFGPAAAGLEFAASNGAYTPTGQVRDAFLSFAAAVLAGGQ